MSVICNQCSHVNPDNSTFCVGCGNRLPQSGQSAGNQQSSANSLNAPNAPTFVNSSGNALPQSSYTQTSAPPYSAPGMPSYVSTSSPPPLPTNTNGSQWVMPPVAPPPPLGQMGSGQGLASIRRAFAGRGKLIMHHSWLLSGENAYAHSGAVHSSVLNNLQQRKIVGLSASAEKLMERGVAMEERDYATAHRGISTVFVFASPAGKDLYISRATTALPAINFIRVIILCILALIMIIGWLSPTPLTYSIYGTSLQVNPILIICWVLSFPILVFLIIMLVLSFVSWLVEKDFLVYLRFNTLNDFQIDDIAMLEQVVDDTIRGSVANVGLDASKVMSPLPVQSYQGKHHIRRF